MDPVFQRLGDVTIQRLEKPKDKVGLQGNSDIMEKESKEERIEQNYQMQLNPEDSQGIKRNFENVPGPSTKRTKFEKMDFKRNIDFESSAHSFSENEITDYDTDSEIESDEDMVAMKSHHSNIESATSELETSTDFFDKLVQEPFEEHESESDMKSTDEIKVEADDYEYDIKEKLKEMGEISFETVKKGDKPKKTEMSTENEVVVTPAKKLGVGEEDPMSDRLMSGNMRRNIREVMDETKLDESTLAAQRQEMERLRRVQEQQRIIREVQRQMAQERVISLLQGGHMSKAGTSGARIGNTVLVKLPNGQTKTMTKLTKKPFDLVKVPKSAIPPTKAKNLLAIKKPSSNLTPSVSIAPVMKRGPQHFPQVPSDTDSENEDMSMMRRQIPRPKPKEPVTTIDISSDDDCIVVSESENDPADDVDEDPSNSGMHTNDEFNQPDEHGRVVVNIGHPEGEPDIYLAPQITRIIKPHQIGGIRFLFDNVIESIGRFDTSTGFGCILAHSMGLGKTLQVVSFSDIFLRNTPAKTILCIMPINTLQNWLAEYNMWLPSEETAINSPLNAHGEVRPRNFNLHVLNDSHKTLTARAKVIREWRSGGGVLLIGYEQFRLLSLRKHPKSRRKPVQPQEPVDDDKNKLLFDEVHEALVKPGPDLVICDEGHRIKNSHASISQALKQMRTKRRVVLTGYPLQNNLMEYWCMVDFVRPNYLGTKTEFCNMFERPIQNGQCIDSTESDIKLMRYRAHVLHSLLVGFVQRRSHTVLQTALPQKEEYVLLVRMTDFQRTLYETFMNEVVRTQTVPNPLKAFAVCCKIWNHPDVLYYFLKKQAGGEAVDIDLEEVSNSTASSNETAIKNKKGSRKASGKGKNSGKPAASITPYKSSGDPATKTSQRKSAASKNNANKIQLPAPINTPNSNTQNVPPSNQNQSGFAGAGANIYENANASANFNEMTPNQSYNQNNANNLQDESQAQNNRGSGNITPSFASKVDYSNFCPSTPSETYQNPPSNYSDSGFSQQSVDYSKNNQGNAFSPAPSIASNPPSNVSQDSGFTNYSQNNQRFPMNQSNLAQNQFPQSNTFASPAASHIKREEFSNSNYPAEDFKNTPSPFENPTGTFQDNSNQNFPINTSNPNFSADSTGFPANNQTTNFHSGNMPPQSPGCRPNNSQNTNYPPSQSNYSPNQTANIPVGNQNPNFQPGANQNSNYSQNSQNFPSNQNPNFPPNNLTYPPNTQGPNFVQNDQGSKFNANTPQNPQNFTPHTQSPNQNTNFPSSNSINFPSNNNNSNNFSSNAQNPSFATDQNPGFVGNAPNFLPSNSQSSNLDPNSHNSNNFPQNQILSPSEQSGNFKQNSSSNIFPAPDENFSQNPATFNAQNQATNFNQPNFEHGFNQNNQTGSFPPNQGSSSQTQSSPTNFHGQQGNYSSNQPSNYPQNNYSNNDSNNFSTAGPPSVPPSPASNFQGNVGFPNNGPSSNFASNNGGKSFSTTPTENVQDGQRVYAQNNFHPTNANPPVNFPHTPSHAFPPTANQNSNYPPNHNPSSNFPPNSNQSPDFASNVNHPSGFAPKPNQSPGFLPTSNQSPGFASNPSQPPVVPTNTSQSPGFSSNPNQSPGFSPNSNQSPTFPSNPNQTASFVANNNQCNFPPNSSQPGSFPTGINHPLNTQNFQQNTHQPPNFSSNTNQISNQGANFPPNSNQQGGFTAANSSQSNNNFSAPNALTNQQPLCNFQTNQQNFSSNKPNQDNNPQGNCQVSDHSHHQSGNFSQNNQQGNFPQTPQNNYPPNNQQSNLPVHNSQQGGFVSNNQQNFANNTAQGNFNSNFASNTSTLQGSFVQSGNQQSNFPANSGTNTPSQNQPNQQFQHPTNFQAYPQQQQQSQTFWGQDPNFKQPSDNCNNFRPPYNQNFTSNQQWIKKEDIKPIINSPIKLEGGSSGSESKPKINIISDIKLSSGGAFDMKKINILSDIKLDPKKEFEDIKEEKPEAKTVKQGEGLLPPTQKLEGGEEDVKIGNEVVAPVKGSTKEDTGIPYDWAIELLKDYVPGIIENSAKMEILFCIIKESIALGDRLLVFSQSLITLDLIEQFLQMNVCPGETHNWAKNVNYYRLDGSTSALEREKLINEFNSNPKIYLFLVSTRAGSLGINLIGANRVVVLDASWNPCHDTQAVCRVYRYGQRKPCFVYRLVVDNCLEKKIYDRQINKQGMSDRVVDECNPDAHLTIKDVSTLCFDDGEEVEVKDWSHCKDNYIDVVLQKVLVQHGTRLNKEPFQHESLLVDRKDKQLSSQEKRLAKKGYEREKQAARQPAYSIGGMSRGHRPVASVRPMQQGGERPTRWIPAEHWQRQGMTAQEMTLPLDVVIPTNQPDKGNIVLKAGQKVLVLKSPKGVYMQLESGKIVAIKTAIKVRGKAEEDAAKVKPGIPSAIKNNAALSVVPQKRAVRPFTPNVAKLNMRSVKQNVPNLVSRIQSVTKRVQTAKTKPYQIGQEIARAVNQTKSETESHPSSSDEERANVHEKRHFNFGSKDSGLIIEPRKKSSDGSRSNSLERREMIGNPEIEVHIPTTGTAKVKSYKSKGPKNSASALQRLEQSTSTIMSESKQTFQETLDSITSTYPEEEKLSDTSSHASTTHSANQSSQSISSTSDQEVIPVEDPPYQSETEATPAANTAETPKSDIPAPEYGYNNYYGYNHVQPYPMPPQGYPAYPQPPPYDMMGYPQQPQYNYGMYPPQNYPPQHQYPQGPYDYGQPPPPQGPVYPGYHSPYPPQQYPPPPQGMYPPPGAPPPAGYPEYQYPPPPPPHNAGPPPPAAAPYYPPGH